MPNLFFDEHADEPLSSPLGDGRGEDLDTTGGEVVALLQAKSAEFGQLDTIIKHMNWHIQAKGTASLALAFELRKAKALMLFPGFPFSHATEKVVVGLIKVAQGILHDPLGDALKPGEISVFACS